MATKRTLLEFFGGKSGNTVAPEVRVETDDGSSGGNADSSSQPAQPKRRKFQPTWADDFDWLEYDGAKDTMGCKYCRAYPKLAGRSDLVSGSSTSFKRETLNKHSGSKHHQQYVDAFLRPTVSKSAVAVGFVKQNEITGGED